jgi:hypothetical protein
MDWPAVHFKSAKLRFKDHRGAWFSYTNQGFRLDGVWSLTGLPWSKGTCITEFKRTCDDPRKAFDIHSRALGVPVQVRSPVMCAA